MIKYFIKMIFFLTLIMGTFITISSSSWIGMWMGLELNLLSFIPLMTQSNNMYSTESSIKYFLIQTFASLVFLFSSIIYITKFSFFNFFDFYYENFLINSAMLLKLGAAPFHFWFPNIIEGLSWINSLILMTWQKLAPLAVISYSSYNFMVILFILFSSIIGALGGLNQTSIRKLLTFSSINHISWILTANLYNNTLWLLYFFIYTILNISIVFLFSFLKIFHLNQIFFISNNQLIVKFCLFMNFFSLGGLPPFLGFLPKWFIIENMMKSNMFFLMFILIMMALITLFFYARLTYSSFLLNYPSWKWHTLYNFNSKNFMLVIITFNLISILSLFMFFLNILIF